MEPTLAEIYGLRDESQSYPPTVTEIKELIVRMAVAQDPRTFEVARTYGKHQEALMALQRAKADLRYWFVPRD
jgi:nicotinamide mononucleotide adenylyltransferase